MVRDDRAHPPGLDLVQRRAARGRLRGRRGRHAAAPAPRASGRTARRRTRARRSWRAPRRVPARSPPARPAVSPALAARGRRRRRLPARRQREHEPVAAAGPRRVDEVAAPEAEQVARDGEVERVAPGHGSRAASNSPSTASAGDRRPVVLDRDLHAAVRGARGHPERAVCRRPAERVHRRHQDREQRLAEMDGLAVDVGEGVRHVDGHRDLRERVRAQGDGIGDEPGHRHRRPVRRAGSGPAPGGP